MAKERLGWIMEDPQKRIPERSSEGALETDGSEQFLAERKSKLEGYLDLSEMAPGDELMIKEYVKISEYDPYKQYHEETYPAPVDSPILYIASRPSKYGVKITVQQVKGLNRNYPYLFFKE